jgi:chromosome partitioning protein
VVRTVAVINSKGGSGKTTTAVNTAAAIAERGLRVLLVDLDAQASASEWLGARSDERGSLDVFLGTRELAACAVETDVPGLALVPASPWLVTAERTLMGDLGVGVMRAVGRLPKSWDCVIIDCPPALSYLSVGALMAVRDVIIPVEAHSIALSGVAAIVTEIDRLRAHLNTSLRDPVILPCRVNRTIHARLVIEELNARHPGLVAHSTIRESIRLAEAAAARTPITDYEPLSGPSQDYRAFAAEFLAQEDSGDPRALRGSLFRRILGRGPSAESARRDFL